MAEQATKSLSDINKAYWDEKADQAFAQEWIKPIANLTTRILREHATQLGLSKDTPRESPVKMLDYACGNGLASWSLAPYVDTIRGIDIAPGMVTKYNERAKEANLPPSTMSAVEGNILSPSEALQGPDWSGFDLAVTCMALHHFEDAGETLRAIVSRLRPGGTIAITDWVPNGAWPPKGHSHHHHGDGHHHHRGDHHHHHHGHEHEEKPEAHATINTEVLSSGKVLDMLEAAGCDISTAYYIVVGEKSHIPEDVVKRPGGVNTNMFLALAKRK